MSFRLYLCFIAFSNTFELFVFNNDYSELSWLLSFFMAFLDFPLKSFTFINELRFWFDRIIPYALRLYSNAFRLFFDATVCIGILPCNCEAISLSANAHSSSSESSSSEGTT